MVAAYAHSPVIIAGMSEKAPVVVAMSGGVDSSVAAALLVEQGYPTIGMMLRLWSEPGCQDANRCCTPEAMAQARRVAARLKIPFYAVDAQQPFYRQVVQPFIEGYAQGITPNPCALCNRFIRWGLLLEQATSLGAEFLATGHYARLRQLPGGRLQLLRAHDANKDQSYILHALNQGQLRRTLFPLGEKTKPEVREIARQLELPVAERQDSQDLCFLAGGELHDFLQRRASQGLIPGEIVDQDGRLLGRHRGLASYTLGQRRGLGVSAPQPLYVLEKRVAENRLVVGPQEALACRQFSARQVNWIAAEPPEAGVRLGVKIRYRAAEARAEALPEPGDRVRVRFEEPQRGVTPGQVAVFYDGEVCLGGGVIDEKA